MARRDVALGAGLTLLALVYLIAASQIPSGIVTTTEVGPRTFPYMVGGALLVVSVGFLLAQAVRGLRRRSVPASSEQESMEQEGGQREDSDRSEEGEAGTVSSSGTGRDSGRDWSRYSHVAMFAAIAIYVFLLSFVGFLLSTAIYIAVGTLIVSGSGSYRGARLLVPAAYGVAGSVALYLLFDRALSVTLPQGIVGL